MAPFREFHEQQMARRVNAPISAMWLLTKPLLHSSHMGTSPHSYLAQLQSGE